MLSVNASIRSMYEHIFPESKFPDSPNPWRISLILELVYGGRTLIRYSVISKLFKMQRSWIWNNLVNNYIPLIFSIYSISFTLNNFQEYSRVNWYELGLCSLVSEVGEELHRGASCNCVWHNNNNNSQNKNSTQRPVIHITVTINQHPVLQSGCYPTIYHSPQ